MPFAEAARRFDTARVSPTVWFTVQMMFAAALAVGAIWASGRRRKRSDDR